jgi:hypothetical protein
MNDTIDILLIEDNPDDHAIVRDGIERHRILRVTEQLAT